MSAPFVPRNYDPVRHEAVVERLLAAMQARDDLLAYTRFTMPDQNDPSDNPKTRYLTGRHHELLARHMHQIETGQIRRLIINLGPRHGKTELASRRFMAWFSGRNPQKSLIFGTYNATYAEDIGRNVRSIIQSFEHRQVFPDHMLAPGSEASDRLVTLQGGQLSFVGRGGTTTGRGGDGIIIDDPVKDRAEAASKTIRDKMWEWFTQVIATRLMTHEGWIVLVQTRWHEDDLIGRLTDPLNPYYDATEAGQWQIIDLPALAFDDDILGRQPGEALWPERFPVPFLIEQQRRDPRGFQALYQGRPSSDGGNFFHSEDLHTYRPDELPKDLRFYAASDHAVSAAAHNDKTALVVVGVDANDIMYVLPDCFHGRVETDRGVEEMLKIIRTRNPLFWWAERGVISKSIGPFLRKRMAEDKTYCAIVEITPTSDKMARAQSIRARMAYGKVRFPSYAFWWPEVRDQLLKFPYGTHDDFVDAMAYLGLGMGMQSVASNTTAPVAIDNPNSFRAMFAQLKEDRAKQVRAARMRGW